MNDNKIIRIKGKGKTKVRPDKACISITLTGAHKNYAETLQHSTDETERIRRDMCSIGFAVTDLKTLDFEVDTEYESYKEKGVYKQRLSGYRYTHVMKLELDLNQELLGKVLQVLSENPAGPEFSISYTVKDPETVKNTLLASAITDAQKKAKVLTEAAGMSMGSIQSIDYSWGEIDLEVRPMGNMIRSRNYLAEEADRCCNYRIDIEPDDIEADDTVTVIWEIV